MSNLFLLPKGSVSNRDSSFAQLLRWSYPTIRYLFQIETHVYAMAIAASVLFGFFPFMVLILSFSQNVAEWSGAVDAIYIGLRDLLPRDPALVSFVERNLRFAVESRGRVEAVSIVLLLFSSNGIFMPLEVALNRLWGFSGDRSYWLNHLIGYGLTLACGLLALSAAVLTSANVDVLQSMLGGFLQVPERVKLIALKMAAIPFSILIVLLVYWLLPNGKVGLRYAAPVALFTGIAIEIVKNIYLWIWPLLDFRTEYGPFFISITLLLWGFIAAMIVLAGAEVCVRVERTWNRTEEPAAEIGFHDAEGAPERVS